ncbi:MAG: BON domain-containing protein [Bacillota bacterium]
MIREQHGDKLLEAVEAALEEALKTEAWEIQVRNLGGSVEISGCVDALVDKARAEEVVKSVPGVKGVQNNLTVSTDGAINDKDITEAIWAKLDTLPRNVLRRVEVTVRDGTVTLHGQTETLAEKRSCIRAVQEVLGVKDINDQLVASVEEVDDATITNRVEVALSQGGRVDARQVNTSVKKGKVTLTGRVDSPEAVAAALRLVAAVPGVSGIDNQLEPLHGNDDPDIARTNLLRSMLDRDPKVSPAQVRAFVTRDTAYLTGEVYNIEAKEAAEKVARQVEGVLYVSNDVFVAAH